MGALVSQAQDMQSRSSAHVSFGQRQDTELWNNPFQESKILGLPVSWRMHALA